jgi:hypothetical protein
LKPGFQIDDNVEELINTKDYSSLSNLLQNRNVNGPIDKEKNTVLITGVHDIEIVKMCIEYGCDVNICNKNKQSALFMLFTKDWDIEILKLLLKSGADPNIKSENGYTSLHSLCRSVREKAVDIKNLKLLLEYGVDPNIETKYGQRPMHSIGVFSRTRINNAKFKSMAEMAKLLLEVSEPKPDGFFDIFDGFSLHEFNYGILEYIIKNQHNYIVRSLNTNNNGVKLLNYRPIGGVSTILMTLMIEGKGDKNQKYYDKAIDLILSYDIDFSVTDYYQMHTLYHYHDPVKIIKRILDSGEEIDMKAPAYILQKTSKFKEKDIVDMFISYIEHGLDIEKLIEEAKTWNSYDSREGVKIISHLYETQIKPRIYKSKKNKIDAVMNNDPHKITQGLHGDEFMKRIMNKL